MGHQYKLFMKPYVSRTRANFFSEGVVNSWNSLPDGIDFSSLPRFKHSINKVDFSRFLKCFRGMCFLCVLYFVFHILLVFYVLRLP